MAKTKVVKIRAETHQALKIMAAQKGMSMIDLIHELVQAAVEAARENS